jgi:hypothetical protein
MGKVGEKVIREVKREIEIKTENEIENSYSYKNRK